MLKAKDATSPRHDFQLKLLKKGMAKLYGAMMSLQLLFRLLHRMQPFQAPEQQRVECSEQQKQPWSANVCEAHPIHSSAPCKGSWLLSCRLAGHGSNPQEAQQTLTQANSWKFHLGGLGCYSMSQPRLSKIVEP